MKLRKKTTVQSGEINNETLSEKEKMNKVLYDVVDHNKLFNILYSGVEDSSNFKILYDMGIRNFLISFHYVQKKKISMTREYSGLGIKFFVDSGAFTFINSLEFKEYTLEQWEKYINQYLRWAEDNSEFIFAIANLDLEYLVGPQKVQEWNEKYFEPFMLRTGIPVCFVHHEDATYLSFDKYCERYPYVGVSWNGIDKKGSDLRYGVDLLKTAEKHKCVVHGMAMTQTALLTSLPFYTVDSTTWMVGLQYGEINYWHDGKMSRLKKDKWKGEYLNALVNKGFNADKLLEEDKEEMIRANVYAFIEAERFVQERLKSRMYWLKPDIAKRTEEDLNDIEYPSVDVLKNIVNEDWKSLAQKFNISQEDSEAVNIQNAITDLTVFMNWESEEYRDFIEEFYTPEVVNEIHNTWINRIVNSEEEKIEDLKKFFKEVLMGENDKLLLLGTNFDRIVKERDDYIIDEEYEEVDVSDIEIGNIMQKYLPQDSEAPEIDSLDDEIFREEGIIPIRDEHGKFLKGQRKVLKPKKLYSNKYPKMACDMCFNAQKCPEYKAGYVCAYNKMFDRYNTRDMADIIQAMQGLAEYQLVRVQRAMLTETINGGMIDANTTAMMNQAMGMMQQLKNMYDISNREILRQTKVLNSDGSQEITTQVSNPQRGGILEQIFGDLTTKEEPVKEEPLKEVVIDSEET